VRGGRVIYVLDAVRAGNKPPSPPSCRLAILASLSRETTGSHPSASGV
jgi:hypothetical protein